jgi:hypothetical protein
MKLRLETSAFETTGFAGTVGFIGVAGAVEDAIGFEELTPELPGVPIVGLPIVGLWVAAGEGVGPAACVDGID